MMPIADAINLPIVLALGFIVFAPITLFVSAVEAIVLSRKLGARYGEAFWPALRANIASTVAGLFVYGLQDFLVDRAGIARSIPDFVEGYRWVAAVLVVIYFAISSIVEWLWIAGSPLAERNRAGVFRAVVLANVVSYAFMGPLFYFATRPAFSHFEVSRDTSWTANARAAVSFIDPETRTLRRIWADGSGLETVASLPADELRMNADATAFVLRRGERGLCAWRSGMSEARVIAGDWPRGVTHGAAIPPDGRRIAFFDDGPGNEASLRIADIEGGEVEVVAELDLDAATRIAWSRDGSQIFLADGKIASFAIEPRANGAVGRLAGKPPPERTAVEYVHGIDDTRQYVDSGRPGDFGPAWYDDERGRFHVSVSMGLMNGISIYDGEVRPSPPGPIAQFWVHYGLLGLAGRWFRSPTILPDGSELLIEWNGGIYLLDWEHQRIGLLARGSRSLTPRAPFRATLD